MHGVVVRQAIPSDVPHLLKLQHDCYPTLSTIALWREEHLRQHMANFPQGQIVAAEGAKLVGHSASFLISSAIALKPHTFREITLNGTFGNHDPNGDTLYGAEIMVHPDYRRKGIGAKFYKYRFEIMRQFNAKYFAAGGRIPGYGSVKDQMTVEQYVEDVVEGRRTDRVLTPQLRSGLRVQSVMPNYLNDPNSNNYATLLVRDNPEHVPATATKTRASGKSSSK
jgi:GNAT superfamily N-acetyltransferase